MFYSLLSTMEPPGSIIRRPGNNWDIKVWGNPKNMRRMDGICSLISQTYSYLKL